MNDPNQIELEDLIADAIADEQAKQIQLDIARELVRNLHNESALEKIKLTPS